MGIPRDRGIAGPDFAHGAAVLGSRKQNGYGEWAWRTERAESQAVSSSPAGDWRPTRVAQSLLHRLPSQHVTYVLLLL